jgi:hypothetical protein
MMIDGKSEEAPVESSRLNVGRSGFQQRFGKFGF